MSSLPCSVGFVQAIFHLWSVLLGPSSLDNLLHNAVKCANAHSSLSMSCQGIMASKGIPTQTRMWLCAGVNFGVAFEVVAADEALLAVITSELPIAKMSLHVRFDVLLAAESLVATLECAGPFIVDWVGAFNELCNVVQGDIGLFD
jgi:hypothetical protein